MTHEIPELVPGETLASASTNPTPQQDETAAPLQHDDSQSMVSETVIAERDGRLPKPHSPETSPGSSLQDFIPSNAESQFRKRKPRKVCRTDSGKLHRMRHGILSREALDALVQVGEDQKTLRRLERQYHAALRPVGPFGTLFFDRFWSSYLKLILVGKLETKLFAGKSDSRSEPAMLALVPGTLPTLVSESPGGEPVKAIPLDAELSPDLLRGLVLAQRYDRHHSREMYRSLAVLLLLRRGGEAALEHWATEILLSGKTHQED